MTDADLPSRLRRVLEVTSATQEELARRADVSLKWVNSVKNAPPGKSFSRRESERMLRVLDEYLAEHFTNLAALIEEIDEPDDDVLAAVERLAEQARRRRSG